ncbi:MAG: Lrp/AsnC ligand binding domain-containing protein [Thermoplasmata archaeon]|nr:Lrp/AsnC ligand binding domain-containing protein [Thermoplasmata archaeon]MCI4354213.1 Lrp/AsnC ligand binding domain-containing protein [Thermoplasmata archaeon]
MADPKSRELTLYVQSRKVITSFFRPASHSAGGASTEEMLTADMSRPPARDSDAMRAGDEAFFLSDDQARCVALTEELALKRGYTVKVTDIAKAGRFERLVTERLRGVQNFPVLMGPGEQRLEGVPAFTEEHLCEMMPAEMPTQRAFTYLKVRGGDLDKIRDVLLTVPEVRELHLLTGDWDVFVVLEFDPNRAKKRQVLDFVTERIRGIPEVLDTSTLVPEYSVTKFPF